MKISVSAYSFYQYINSGKLSLFDTISKADRMGFDAIEFLDMPGGSLSEQKDFALKLKNEADRLGMTINAYTIGANLWCETGEESLAEVERLKGQVEVASILGCHVMRHDACYSTGRTGKSRSFDMMLPTIAENARKVAEYAANFGIKTCVENHGYVAQDSDRVERLFNAVAHDNFGILVDIGNFVCVDEDNVTAVSRLAPYAVHAHAKDMYKSAVPLPGYGQTRGCNYFKGAILGEGDVDVRKCVDVLKRAGYDGYLSIEFEGSEDCVYGIEKGYEYLKNLV
mgnify:CR=1 FL=1